MCGQPPPQLPAALANGSNRTTAPTTMIAKAASPAMITIITCLRWDRSGPAGFRSFVSKVADSVFGAVTENRLVPSEPYRSD